MGPGVKTSFCTFDNERSKKLVKKEKKTSFTQEKHCDWTILKVLVV